MTWPWPPIWIFRICCVSLLLSSAVQADIEINLDPVFGILPKPMYGTSKHKRVVQNQEPLENITRTEDSPYEIQEDQAELHKRQILGNLYPQVRGGVTYALSSTMAYMAIPYGNCNNDGAGSDSECPVDFGCVCQQPGTSKCLPELLTAFYGCLNPYDGPENQPSTTVWKLRETDSYMAEPFGQCGGTTPSAGSTWNSAQTACPNGQVCDCQNKYYSQCIPISDAVVSGTGCPANSWDCDYSTSVTLPPPTATASMWEQCGGYCWTGPTNCPAGASCWTETSPVPGAYAMCDTARPSEQYKVRLRGRGEAINVPARVQAVATPIDF